MIPVLHIVCFPELYGTQRSLLSTVSCLDRGVFEPLVAAPADPDFARAAAAAAAAEFVPVRQQGLFDLESVRALRGLMRRRGVRIVHCHLGISSFLGLIAARPLRIPVIVTRHFINDRYTEMKNPLLRYGFFKTYQWMNRKFARIICVSEAVRAAVIQREKAPPDKCVVIPNGVAVIDSGDLKHLKSAPRPAPLQNLPPGRKIVFCTSRLVAEKGLDTLLIAASACVKRGADLGIVIAGDGPLRNDLIALAARLGVADRVVFPGFVHNIREYLAAADMFVLPALNEPFGIALIEAMAAELPIAASAAGGPLEIIEHDETGLLFPPRDAAALSRAISDVLENPERAASLAAAARVAVMRYEINAVTKRIEDVYRAAAAP